LSDSETHHFLYFTAMGFAIAQPILRDYEINLDAQSMRAAVRPPAPSTSAALAVDSG